MVALDSKFVYAREFYSFETRDVFSSDQKTVQYIAISFVSLSPELWMIKRGTPTDEELQNLAEEVPGDWKKIGRAAGLEEKHLNRIEIDNPDNVCERAFAMLYKWKEQQGRKASYENLAKVLDHELVERRDLVEKFCCDFHSSKQQH